MDVCSIGSHFDLFRECQNISASAGMDRDSCAHLTRDVPFLPDFVGVSLVPTSRGVD